MRAPDRRAVLTGMACAALPLSNHAARAATSQIGATWPCGTPERGGFDAARLATAADQIGAIGDRQGLVVIHDGRLIFERYWDGAHFTADPHWRNVSFSSGKSWGATMVGRAVTQGHLRIDDLASAYVPADRTGLLPGTTIRHLLTMTSGGSLVTKPSSKPPRRMGDTTPPGPADEYRRSIGHSEERGAPEGYGVSLTPGERFFYDGAAADHLAEIITAATGRTSHDYMMQEVVAKLGCTDFAYQPEGVDRNGDVRIGGSILLSCRDLARLGQLYLDKGRWNGRSLVDPAFIAAATTPSPRNPDYGFLWWLNTSGKITKAPRLMFFAAGAFGQFCFVVPERRLVVATMGFGAGQLSGDAIWEPLAPVLLT